ncbi:copper chaperone [Pleomorphomonas diazotrophica]|uniref:Copper chaperone n=1 Tax=Pleomorphomonas diazotrophica TaxID=1166257 RepID=A0A1I4TV02_9HYPH|nr:heavy metal-associated domain-containing protein [Pleomorphomonas diazotrophica]PKR87700.1 copper chaperone [Pleomorphomonas diazotrophica]SFM80519.1 copper chaperone [Pleomorphomonas diazotrophica]
MIELNVKGMMCGGCANSVEKAIKRVDADATVTVDLAAGKVSVNTKADAKVLGDAIEAAGYEVAA